MTYRGVDVMTNTYVYTCHLYVADCLQTGINFGPLVHNCLVYETTTLSYVYLFDSVKLSLTGSVCDVTRAEVV